MQTDISGVSNWNGYLFHMFHEPGDLPYVPQESDDTYYALTGDISLEDAAGVVFTENDISSMVDSGDVIPLTEEAFDAARDSRECRGYVDLDKCLCSARLKDAFWQIGVSYINKGQGGFSADERDFSNTYTEALTSAGVQGCYDSAANRYEFDFKGVMMSNEMWNGRVLTINKHARRNECMDPVDRELMTRTYDHAVAGEDGSCSTTSYLLLNDMTFEDALVGYPFNMDTSAYDGNIPSLELLADPFQSVDGKRHMVEIDATKADSYINGASLKECMDIYSGGTCVVMSINGSEGGVPFENRNESNTKAFEFMMQDYWLELGVPGSEKHIDISFGSGKKQNVKDEFFDDKGDPTGRVHDLTAADLEIKPPVLSQPVDKPAASRIPDSRPNDQYSTNKAPQSQAPVRNSVFINRVPIENIDTPAFARADPGTNTDIKTVRIPLSTDALRKLAIDYLAEHESGFEDIDATGQTDKHKLLSFAIDVKPRRIINPERSDSTRNIILSQGGEYNSMIKVEAQDRKTGKSSYIPTFITPKELSEACESGEIASVSTLFEKAKKRSEMTDDELKARDDFDRKRFLNRVDNLFVTSCRFDGYKTVEIKTPGQISQQVMDKLNLKENEPFRLFINVRDKQIIKNSKDQTCNIVLCGSGEDPDTKRMMVSVFDPSVGRRGHYRKAYLTPSDITGMYYSYYGRDRFAFEQQTEQSAEPTPDQLLF